MSPRIPHEILLAFILWLLGLLGSEEARAQASKPTEMSPARRYAVATGFLQRDLPELALAEYQSLLRDAPEFAQRDAARYGLAVAAYRLKQYDTAAEALAPLTDAASFDLRADALLLAGQTAIARGKPAEADRPLAALLDEFPEHAHAAAAAALLVDVHRATERLEACLKAADRFLERHAAAPQAERVRWLAADAALARQDFRAAAERFDEYVKRHGESPLAARGSLLAGQCYARIDDPESAERRLARLRDSDDREIRAAALSELVSIYLRAARDEEAERAAAAFLEQFPKHELAPRIRLARGQLAARRGDRETARRMLADADAPADRAAADRALASLALKSGDYADAAQRLGEIVRAAGDAARPADRLDLASALLQSDKPEQAAAQLDKLVESADAAGGLSAQQRRAALELRAHARFRLQRYADAAADARRWLKEAESDSGAPEITALAVEALALDGQDTEVAALARAALPNLTAGAARRRVISRAAFSLLKLEKADDALPLLRETVENESDVATRIAALSAIGQIAQDRKDWPGAEAAWRGVLEAATSRAQGEAARVRLGIALARLERDEDAATTLAPLAEREIDSPDREHASYERARCLARLKRDAEARREFDRLLRDRPTTPFFVPAAQELARLLSDSGDTARAGEWLAKAAEKSGDEGQRARLTIAAGRARLDAGDAAGATKTFLDARRQAKDAASRDEAAASFVLACAAALRCEELVSVHTAEPLTFAAAPAAIRARAGFELARCLLGAKRSDAAAALLESCAASDDDRAIAVLAAIELAKVSIEAERWDAALARLKPLDFATLAPTERDRMESVACYYRAYCHSRLNAAREAAAEALRCLELGPPPELLVAARRLAGESHLAAGDAATAVTYFETLTREADGPIDASVRLRLAEALAACDQWRKAEEAYAEFLARHADDKQSTQARFGLAWAREQQQRYAEAIEAYRPVASSNAALAPRAQFQIGECLFALRKHEEAVREFLKVDVLFADSEWAAASLYEAARCFDELAKAGESRRQIEELLKRFPDSKWAKLARERAPREREAAAIGREREVGGKSGAAPSPQ
ncbi:MAG: tetratricopeptide repeat protein [Phycisphaerae bacterium]|nr:tetratricopeptide repeat protein [Phycisphaerae bacterium]